MKKMNSFKGQDWWANKATPRAKLTALACYPTKRSLGANLSINKHCISYVWVFNTLKLSETYLANTPCNGEE